jgi:shikimate dehydrogenase
MIVVNGATRVLGIVGHPIAQVRAPEVWSRLCHAYGINMVCIPFDVSPQNLATFLSGLRGADNLVGMIVTIPHKPASVDAVDALTARADVVRSVNFIAVGNDGKWTGDIIDGEGFIANLKANNADPKGMRALLVGIGGVGTAMAFALAECDVSELVVYDKDMSRSSSLAERLAKRGYPVRTGVPDPAGFDLIVNASPVGMRDADPLPMDADRIDPRCVVADVIVHQTKLLRRAAERGCRTFDGTGMMEHQLATMAGYLGLEDAGDFSAAAVRKIVAEHRL